VAVVDPDNVLDKPRACLGDLTADKPAPLQLAYSPALPRLRRVLRLFRGAFLPALVAILGVLPRGHRERRPRAQDLPVDSAAV
jgi:hypothetical protein